MIRLCLLLVLTGVSSETIAASFDCNNAKTKIEKLICGDQQLSGLDSKLDEIYLNQRKKINSEALQAEPTGAEKDQRLVAAQRLWLKRSRNICADEACLKQAYTNRIDALDPLADNDITCDNMRKYPERVFIDDIDLGSGHGSPIQVDYTCPENVASLPFLKKLLDLTETIRGETFAQPQCSGSIVHALWRYYHFHLAEAGFAPLIFLERAKIDQDPNNERSLARLRPNILHKNLLDYFKQWSEKSPYNYQLHSDFFSEFDRVLPKLANHYKKSFGMKESQATEVARHALMVLVGRAAGSFPSDSFTQESKLLKLVNDPHSTFQDVKQLLTDTTDNGKPITKNEIYHALQTALLHNHSKSYIEILLEKLSPEDIAIFSETGEPLLSFSIRNHENLRFLLEKQVAVNAANDFGKTALFYAIDLNDREATELLLSHKANVNHAYKSATELRNGDDCVYPDLSHTKRTSLMHAAQHADVEMLKLLINYGADVNAVDDQGFNALDYAVAMGHNKENEAFLASLSLKQNNVTIKQEPHQS